MTHEAPHVDPGDYPANPADLEGLFDTTAQKLVTAGRLFDFNATGTIEGFHVVVTGSPGYEIEIPSSRVRDRLPEVAEAINVGTKITLQYALPHWCNGGLDWMPAACTYYVTGLNGLAEEEPSTMLFLTDETQLSSDASVREIVPGRDTVSAESRQLSADLSPEERVWGSVHDDELSKQLGTDKMTVAECRAFQMIVDNLDALTEPG